MTCLADGYNTVGEIVRTPLRQWEAIPPDTLERLARNL
jgi:hypothetical protein